MKIRRLFSCINSYFFAGITFLGFTAIYTGLGGRGRYSSVGESNWYFVLIGVFLILPFTIKMVRLKRLEKKAIEKNTDRMNQLMRTGDKIDINLNSLKIQTNSYQQEVSVGRGYQKRFEKILINHNVISLEVPYQNTLLKYKINIEKEPDTLRIHFAIKGTTTLYIDSKNPYNYYLDLSFINA